VGTVEKAIVKAKAAATDQKPRLWRDAECPLRPLLAVCALPRTIGGVNGRIVILISLEPASRPARSEGVHSAAPVGGPIEQLPALSGRWVQRPANGPASSKRMMIGEDSNLR
jgi:hypothetical protein